MKYTGTLARLLGGIAPNVAVAAMLAGLPLAAGSAEAIEWRMHSVWTESRQEAKDMAAFADRINEKAQGRLKVTVYHGGSLALKDVDVLRSLPAGAAELWVIIPSILSRDAPQVANLYPTGSILRAEEHPQVIPILEEIYADFFTNAGIQVVGFQHSGAFPLAIFCKDKPVKSIADLQGVKLRVFNKEVMESFNKLGASAQVIPQSELYVALNTGVVDCALYAYSSGKTISLQEVTRYGSDFVPYASVPNVILANKKAWDTLPPGLQNIVSEAAGFIAGWSLARDVGPREAAVSREFEATGDFEVIEGFSDGDRKSFQKAALDNWYELTRKAGPKSLDNAKRLMDKLGLTPPQ